MPGASYPGPKGIAAVLTTLSQGRQCWEQPETRPAACLREWETERVHSGSYDRDGDRASAAGAALAAGTEYGAWHAAR